MYHLLPYISWPTANCIHKASLSWSLIPYVHQLPPLEREGEIIVMLIVWLPERQREVQSVSRWCTSSWDVGLGSTKVLWIFFNKPLVIPLLVSRLYPSLVSKIQNIYLIPRHVSDLLWAIPMSNVSDTYTLGILDYQCF